MERLTKVDDQGRLLAYLVNDTGLPTIVMKGDPYRKLIERLKAYEDTGLEPCEIPVLLDRLKRASEQWNIWCDAYQNDVPVWIPVAEQLPEEGAEVIVTVDGGDKIDTFVSSDVCVAEGWQNWNGVIAWMPLPEPYKPEN